MIPAALANSVYSYHNSFVPELSSVAATAYGNVIAVDFTKKAASVSDAPSSALSAVEPVVWRAIATKRLAALHRLKAGWDGDDSVAISADALAMADRILGFAFEGVSFAAPPVAVPCSDGSLQLEWWLTDTRFELTVESDGATSSWAQDRSSGHEAAADGAAAIELLSKWSSRLTADKLAVRA